MSAKAQLHQVVVPRAEYTQGANGTLEEAARSFAKAMIDADLAALERVSRGAAAGYPPRFVLDSGRATYADRELRDLTFDVFEDENRVRICSRDGALREDVKFKHIDGRYYFIYYNR